MDLGVPSDVFRHFVPLVDRLVHAFGFFSVSIFFLHATPMQRLFWSLLFKFLFWFEEYKID
jgi:hypothetical protein